jgi:pseudouridine-5'-phosphate glycosidase
VNGESVHEIIMGRGHWPIVCIKVCLLIGLRHHDVINIPDSEKAHAIKWRQCPSKISYEPTGSRMGVSSSIVGVPSKIRVGGDRCVGGVHTHFGSIR